MNPLVLPLNIGKDDTFRMTWKGRLFKAKGALVLPRKLTTQTDVEEVLDSAQMVIKLQEFSGALREKMLAALSPEKSSQHLETQVYGLVVRVNIKTAQLTHIEDLRSVKGTNGGEQADFMSDAAQVIELTSEEKIELGKAINTSLTASVLEALRHPFVSFHPQLSETWKEQNLKGIQQDKLVPFQMLFPNSQPIERFVDGERFVIDDLYCTNPTCACTDVTCVVLKLDPTSGQEVAWGGFKWASDNEKFKVLPQFSSKFNAAEWFKQFDKASGFDLKMLLSSRQKFMRNDFIAARKAASG